MKQQEIDELVEQRLIGMIKDNPVGLFQYFVLQAGKEVVKTKAANMLITTDATFEGQRYKVTCKTTVKKIKMPKHLV